jgi:hypothetical protein
MGKIIEYKTKDLCDICFEGNIIELYLQTSNTRYDEIGRLLADKCEACNYIYHYDGFNGDKQAVNKYLQSKKEKA